VRIAQRVNVVGEMIGDVIGACFAGVSGRHDIYDNDANHLDPCVPVKNRQEQDIWVIGTKNLHRVSVLHRMPASVPVCRQR